MSGLAKYYFMPIAVLFLFLGGEEAKAGGDKISCKAIGSPDISMDARFEQRDDGRTKFDASYEAGANSGHFDGEELAVFVAGQSVGTITLALGALGLSGDLDFDSNIDGFTDDSVAFPSNFPAVSVNTSVTVGTLGCSLD